jgi:phosphatidylglycerophosphate synthase
VFDWYLRALKDRLLAPISRMLGPRVSPIAITWLALVVGLASAGAVFDGRLEAALVLWLLNRLLDGLDGTQARTHGRESQFGAYLDVVLDFVVYAAIPLAIVLNGRSYELALSGMLLLAAFYVNAASWIFLAAILEQRREGAAARHELTTVTMPPAIIAGTETVVFYSLFILFPSLVSGLFAAMALLVLFNVALRLRWARNSLQPQGPV